MATSRQATADAAAKTFGAKPAYGDATNLFGDPGIDLVAVCVKVAARRGRSGGMQAHVKHMYCEWPLGRDIPEAENSPRESTPRSGSRRE